MEANDISGCGAIICTHCAKDGFSILWAKRDTPLEDVDSGWQFTCGAEDKAHGIEDAQLWRVDEILIHDPTIKAIIHASAASSFTRPDVAAPWQSEKYRNED